ncbi:hypothetical protein [Luteimonas salinilitoris]|uniref:Uncharacterized protein n=1 Tax=Luteimonas salinilitoris TaxID=3237697 RepID=A0ABV4HUY8_9GAMM
MRAMPRAIRRPRIAATGAPAGPRLRRPPDAVGITGIARMAPACDRSIGSGPAPYLQGAMARLAFGNGIHRRRMVSPDDSQSQAMS